MKGTVRARLRYAGWRYRLYWHYRHLAPDGKTWIGALLLFAAAFRQGVPYGWART